MRSIVYVYIIFLCLLHLTSVATDSTYFNSHFRLLPLPQKITLTQGKGLSYTGLRAIALVNTHTKPVMSGITASLPLGKSSIAGTLSFIIDSSLSLPSPEGYILEIKEGKATIKATKQEGLFYGLQTLNQLLEDARDQQIEIPGCSITDYPEIAYRAVHLDLKHHLDATKYYYDMVDRLAAVKINAIIIEFEDKLRYRGAPQVGAGNAISVEEFAALSKYAHERFIEISPLVQGLGHASFILKHEEYKNLRDDTTSDWVFDPLNPDTYKLQCSLYEDAIAATPNGKYLHVGGDEVGKLGKSELCKKSGMSAIELQLYWLKKVTDFAEAHHRIPIFWDDMVFKQAGLYETTYDPSVSKESSAQLWEKNQSFLDQKINLFPANCVYMRWNYDDCKLPGNQRALDWYKENNLHAMAATATQCMSAMLSRKQSNFQPVKDFCQLTAQKHLDGILCTVWDDCSVHLETTWRGMYDFALFSWNYEDIAADKAHTIFRHRFFSPALAPIDNEFQDALETALPFWETAFLKEGDRENYHKQFKLIDLPDIKNPGGWSAANKERLDNAVKHIVSYDSIKNKIAKAQITTRRNEYALEVLHQINELQVYPAKLLLLLREYDKASTANMKAVSQKIIAYIQSFRDIRNNLEKVYSETRIMGNAAEYQLDSNFHEHLANGTNNTDWMYMYELPMNQKIMEWLVKQ
ncbi:MAG: family 20 glycosylhydrolase [Agriterribacter sp.]